MGKFTIKRPERVVSLCLDASLRAEWEAAERALSAAQREGAAADARLGESPAMVAAQRVQDIEEAMRGDSLDFRLRAMPRSEWAALIAANPPGDDPGDKSFGANVAALAEQVIPASIVEVKRGEDAVDFDPAADWSDLADEMTDRQFTDFWETVLILNRGEVQVPTSRAALRVLRSSSQS